MDNNTLVKKVFTVGLLAAGLAACSGANNTLNSRAGGTDPSARTACTAENCVRIEFVDDPVINLNYSCGTVVNVTDETGVASCPANSRVEFYIQSTKTLRRVVLGTFLVEPAGQSILRVTPLDLVTKRDEVTRLSSPEAAAAINVTRFLQALRERNNAGVELEPFIATAPVNRIRLTDALKDQLDVLSEDVFAGDFISEQFVTKLRPFLEATGRTPIDTEQAQARLLTTLKAIKTGVYFGTPAITLPSEVGGTPALDGLTGNTGINDLRLGIEGEAARDAESDSSGLLRSTMALYSLVDRDGMHIGQAMQWTGRANTSEGVYNLYRRSDFDKLRPVNSLGGFDPITNKVNGQWQWRSTNPSLQGKVIDFNEGKLLRNYSMVGSRRVYENLTTDKNEPAAGTLGRWIQRSFTNAAGVTQPVINGTATISKVANVNTFFDRTVWRTRDTVFSGERFVFPLHVTLRFRYGSIASGCPQGGCTDLPDLSVTILESGNIISDFSAGATADTPLLTGNCSPVNPATLVDESGVQEYRVGTVRAAYTGVNVNDAFIGPTMLFSGDVFREHDGLQIASLAATPRVKINVAGPISASTSPTINITDSSSAESELGGQDPAQWGNIYNAYLALYDTTGMTDAQKQRYEDARKRQEGTVTATLTPCYNAIDRIKP